MDKTIEKMTKSELLNLIQDAIKKGKNINSIYDDICTKRDATEDIKKQSYDLVSKLKEHDEEFQQLKYTFFGSINKEERKLGEIGHIGEKINELEEAQRNVAKLEEKINKELLSGTTTISLSKIFKDKASEYNKYRRIWEGSLISTLIAAIFYSIQYVNIAATNIAEVFINFIPHTPTFIFFVWLVIFIGNRSAESKKLEESYTHKAVVSQSFTGYKKSIEELDSNDKNLLSTHMDNLLATINKDSSLFLSSKGENHPVIEAGGKIASAVAKNN